MHMHVSDMIIAEKKDYQELEKFASTLPQRLNLDEEQCFSLYNDHL